MAVVRTIARPMLASIFAIQGYDTMRHPERVAAAAEPVVQQLSGTVPGVPPDTEQAVRINGAVQLGAATLLALGWWPRLAALVIAGTLVPTTAAGHRFWEAEDEKDRTQQRIHFLKNLSMLGGLLIAAADTGGKPSVAWRARHSAQEARLVARTTRASAKVSARVGAKAGAKAGRASAKAAMIRARAGQAGAKAAKAGTRAGQARAKAGQLRSRALSR